jgi:hypothetical protein
MVNVHVMLMSQPQVDEDVQLVTTSCSSIISIYMGQRFCFFIYLNAQVK